MRQSIYLLAILLAGLLPACDRADDCDPVEVMGATGLSDATPLDARIKEIYEQYNVLFKYDFDIQEYEYNWTESLSAIPYTPADPACAKDVIDAIEEKVFRLFPDGFIRKYLQPNILLADSVKMEYSAENWDDGSEVISWYTLTGNISKNNMTIGQVNPSFKADAAGLQEAWISLFIERMMLNKNFWPHPTEFEQVNGGGTTFLGCYWDGNYDLVQTWMGSYPEGHSSEKFQWWEKGILKPGRLGCSGYVSMMDGLLEMYTYTKGTLEQDFGDYAAFIMTKTPAEKEAFWQTIREKAAKQEYDADEVLGMMQTKVRLVQEYFRKNFGFELPEPQ